MEEKLNMIFEKLLDIEEQLKLQMFMQEHKKVENELKNSKCHLEDIDYRIKCIKERKTIIYNIRCILCFRLDSFYI